MTEQEVIADLVERLREGKTASPHEAADALEAIAAENTDLRQRIADLEEAVEAMQRGMKAIFNHPRGRK